MKKMQRNTTIRERTSVRSVPTAAPIGVEVLGIEVIVNSWTVFPVHGIVIVSTTAS